MDKMKKFLTVLLISMVFCLPVMAVNEANNINLLSARGNAKVEIKPDMAIVTVAVETESKNLRDAIKENNAASDKVISNLKKVIGKNDQIKTTNFNVFPMYSPNSKRNEIIGYRVNNQVQVKTYDIVKPGEIIEIALNNGANRVSGLSYGINDTQKVCNGLLEEAVKSARKEADTLAKALGVKISGVSKVTSSCNDMIARPYMMKASFGMAEMDAAAPPLEAGETTVSAEVFVDFIIE
ncbi:MAG: hypothetical protein A2Y25_09115 [Candidatus Melainabacteria bacterium GWF2_37_15]|nr:MAG: hypothetical protein A2Y25_09115 [Candidatus Melainabacteria bacterium GWF2_37_15]